MVCGLTIENQNLIIDKSKSKKDGVYAFRGVAYRVRDKQVTHLAAGGRVLVPYGNFNISVGTCGVFNQDCIDVLKSIK